MLLPFLKMHGTGNDFVILDAGAQPIRLTPLQIAQLADRGNPITKGCDQVIVMELSAEADIFMRIYNADGGEVDACGNAARCVGWLAMEKKSTDTAMVQTKAGLLDCGRTGDHTVTVDMGTPKLQWRDIPLSRDTDTLHVQIGEGALQDPVAVSMGNPHAVFFVPDAAAIDLATLGPKLEHHSVFPERANIGVAQVNAKDSITLRVWERGAGETLSCGTGACAALAAAHLRGLTGRNAQVRLPGGNLRIAWREDGHVSMTGPVAKEFEGNITLDQA